MEALKQWVSEMLSDADPGALMALGFVALVVLLSVYVLRHWAKRKKALLEMMPRLGFDAIAEPDPERLVPELLFHPNGFGERSEGVGQTQDVLRRVPMAWSGRLAGRDAIVMDVSVARRHTLKTQSQDAGFHLDRTVIRCSGVPKPAGEPPPDLLIEERVLFKGRVEGQRAVGGAEVLGEHYFLFSGAPHERLERWITPQVQAALGEHRLWTIAVHDGVFYLCRGTNREEPHEMESFLRQGEFLLTALVADR